MIIVDKYTREYLAIEAKKSITAKGVVRILATMFTQRGVSTFISSDNGPEFIAKVVKRWLKVSGVRTLYIGRTLPGKRQLRETFISRFGDELLMREMCTSLREEGPG